MPFENWVANGELKFCPTVYNILCFAAGKIKALKTLVWHLSREPM